MPEQGQKGDLKVPEGLHLLVLVHGLWGNPVHLKQVATAITSKHDDSKLHVLVCKRNAGSYTYDGIEVGGERVAQEVEDELEELAKAGKKPTKVSFTGYSLGGLVARYAIGLLHSRGFFDKLEPVNFTTFATPHLGVRTPSNGWRNSLFNTLGGNTLCTSGRQLFLLDTFRDTGRSLIDLLADPNSIFIKGLQRFPKRSIYCNIVNDRAVPWYTASITATDPFLDLDQVKLNYLPDTDDVLLDGDKPASPRDDVPTGFMETVSSYGRYAAARAPLWLFLATVAPIGTVAFLANAGYQTYSSSQRVRQHEQGLLGVPKDSYRLPLLVEQLNRAAEHALERADHALPESFIDDKASATEKKQLRKKRSKDSSSSAGSQETAATQQQEADEAARLAAEYKDKTGTQFPVLALTPAQFRMIDTLTNTVGFDRFPVHIKKVMHSHAAIVVRMKRDAFDEGYVVSGHWADRFVL